MATISNRPPPTLTSAEDKALEQKLESAERDSSKTVNQQSPADAAKIDAQRRGEIKTSQVNAAKFRDELQSSNGSALIESLQTQSQSTLQQDSNAANTSPHQALAQMRTLETLMGPPPQGSVEIAEAFSPALLEQQANQGVRLGLATIEQLLGAFGPEVPVDPAEQTRLLGELQAHFGLNAEKLSAVNLAGATPGTAAKLEKLQKIVETFFEKTASQTPEEAVAHLPTGLMQSLKDNLPQIKKAVTDLFNAADAAAAQAKNGQEIIIPNATVVAAEKALAPVVQQQAELVHSLRQVAKQTRDYKTLVADARKQIKNGASFATLKDRVHPSLARAIQWVVPYAKGEKNEDAKPTKAEQEQALEIFESLTSAASVESTSASSSAAGARMGGSIGIDLDTADISCLIYWIMMQTANSATEDLREIMKELKANIDAKKQQRELIHKMKENQTRIGTELRKEYDQLVGEGVIKPTFSFEQYQAWRSVEYSEDGRAQLSVLDYSALPKLATEGPPKEESEQAVSGGPVPNVPGVTPLAADTAQVMADELGIFPSDIQYMYAYFMSQPNLKNGDFDAYLKGKGLKPVGDPPSEQLVSANSAVVSKFFEGLGTSGKANDAKLAEDAKKAQGVDAPTSAANLKAAQKLAVDLEIMKALKAAGVTGLDGEIASITGQLNAALAKSMTKADVDAFNAWKDPNNTDPNSLRGQVVAAGSYIKGMIDFIESTVKGAVEGDITNQLKRDDEDNHAQIMGYSIGPNGASVTVRSHEYDDNNNTWDTTWRQGNDFTTNVPNEGITVRSHVTWPEPGPAGEAVLRALGKAGKTLSGSGQLTNAASKLSNPSIGSYTYTGATPTDPNAAPAPTTSLETSLSQGWAAQHQTDVLDKKADEKRKEMAEQKAAKQKEMSENFANGLGGTARVELDADGFDAQRMHWSTGSLDQYKVAVEDQQGKLDSLSDLGEPMQMRLQQYMDRRAKAMETLSNLMKKMSQTAETIVNNMK